MLTSPRYRSPRQLDKPFLRRRAWSRCARPRAETGVRCGPAQPGGSGVNWSAGDLEGRPVLLHPADHLSEDAGPLIPSLPGVVGVRSAEAGGNLVDHGGWGERAV